MSKKKIFWFSDAPVAHTGFGVVTRNLMLNLSKKDKYLFFNLGINYFGDPYVDDEIMQMELNKELFMWPTPVDRYGRDKFYSLLYNIQPDILFILNDYDAVQWISPHLDAYKKATGKDVVLVLYSPVDGEPIYPEYIEWIKKYTTKFIVVSKYGQKVLNNTDKFFYADQLYHGVDRNIFKPLSKEEKDRMRESAGLKDKFVVMGSGVNQLRKFYPALLASFAEFSRDKKDTILYLHTQKNFRPGWNLIKLARLFGIQDKVYFTDNIEGPEGVDPKDLNSIYNLADVYVTTSVGEGFGVMTLEAMAAGLPIIYHDCTSTSEVVDGNGLKVSTDYKIIFPNRDRELVRPLPNLGDVVAHLNTLYSNQNNEREKYSKLSLNRASSPDFNWELISDKLDSLLDDAISISKEELITLEEIL